MNQRHEEKADLFINMIGVMQMEFMEVPNLIPLAFDGGVI